LYQTITLKHRCQRCCADSHSSAAEKMPPTQVHAIGFKWIHFFM
jgi:hypothetical protein